MSGSRKFPAAAAFGLTAPGLAATARRTVQSGLFPWHPSLAVEGKAIARAVAEADQDRLTAALADLARNRGAAVKAGIDRYLTSSVPTPELGGAEVWSAGTTRLMDFGENGRPVLMIPSLINRATILDITPGRSIAEFLAGHGVRPFVLDWQIPGPEETGFSIADYVRERVVPAVDWIDRETGQKPSVLGHCTGGLVALATACAVPSQIVGLAMISTPWDFHAGGPVWLTRAAGSFAGTLGADDPERARLGELPPALFDMFFASVDPIRPADKFRRFANGEISTVDEAAFVAIEDWANDGVPVAMPAAMEFLTSWYGRNATAGGDWAPATASLIAALTCPVMIAFGTHDRIVPSASAHGLTARFADADVIEAPTGHVGLVAGRRAETLLWRPLLNWIKAERD